MDIDNCHQEAEPLTVSLLDNVIEVIESDPKLVGKRKSCDASTRDGKENSSTDKRPKTDGMA